MGKNPQLSAEPPAAAERQTAAPGKPVGAAERGDQDLTLLKSILENIPQHVFWKDTASVYLGCNHIFARVAGLHRPEEIVGLTDFDLPWKKKEAEFFRLCDERVIEYDRPEYNIISSRRQADGQDRWIRTTKVPLHDPDGRVIGILGTGEDITDQIETEERLRNYEIIASTIDDMIAIVDADLRYLAVNDAYCAAYQLPRETLLQSHIRDLAEENVYEELIKPKVVRVLSGELLKFEGWRNLPGIGRCYLHYTYYPIFNDTDRVTSFVAQLQNITETKQLENQLQQAQKMEAIGRLAGGIAHDFNNILSVINGYSELALMTTPDGDPNHSRLQEINNAGTRAARLTQQLLAFSRKQIIKPQPLNLAAEVEEFSQMIKRLLGESISVEILTDAPPWRCLMDRSQLEQILLNLTINARDAMPEDGCLTLHLRNRHLRESLEAEGYVVAAGDYLELSLTDNGCGMSPEIKARIFEPFFTTKPAESGTGLGLSTVYGIIKQNHGYISVVSAPGEGTTFRLLFPRCPEESNDSGTAADHGLDGLPRGSGTVLLVEDNQMVRNMCATVLDALGYRVLEAANGREVLKLVELQDHPIDLLLTDVVMPELSGAETAAILSARQPGLRVLFMSGHTEDNLARHAIGEREAGFIQKPVTPRNLALTVWKMLSPGTSPQ